MKEEIKRQAIRLFTISGYGGVSFGDITEQLGTTRANIHYHFGSKSGLAEEVLDAAADNVLRHYREIWTDPSKTLKQKLGLSYAFNEKRYREYNGSGEGRIWSLIARFRIERNVVTQKMVSRLNEVTKANEEFVRTAVLQAIANKELTSDAPVDEICCLISGVIHFAPLISQAPHDIRRLEETYLSLSHLIEKAYAKPANRARRAPAARRSRAGGVS